MIPYPDLSQYRGLAQAQIDWLLKSGATVEAMVNPEAIVLAHGHKAHDGKFEQEAAGKPWLAFPEPEDVIYWQPRTGELATWNGRAFALGEEAIDNPATYSFDAHLSIFADPLEWLQSKRDGCVVLDWSRAFDRLRDAPRIAVAEPVLFQYRRHMQPKHLPAVAVITDSRKAAA